MSAFVCPGPCNHRYREAIAAYEKALADYDPLDPNQERPERPQVYPWTGEPLWCSPCKHKIRLRLAQLDTLAALLEHAADGYGESAASERVSRSDEAASPSPAVDDLDELTRMLIDWEDAYRSIRGWDSAPPRGDMASVQTEVTAWLGRHLDGILAAEDIAEPFGTEVLRWHRGMKHQAKAGVETLRKPLRCPRCRLMLLVWTEGSDRVDCRNPDCAAVMSYAEYETEAGRLAAAFERGQTDLASELA
jgi:hypothetical protein